MTEINYLEILKLCFLGGKGGCSGCPFKKEGFPKCLNIVYKGIEDTINNQKAEIKKCENIIRFADKTIETQSAEIERLEETKNRLSYNLQAVLDERADHSEAVKEFAERLKEKAHRCDLSTDEHEYYSVGVFEIDNLAKEMVGEG